MIRCALVLCLGLAGCQWLPAVAAGASWLGAALDVARAGADAYFARHPHLTEADRVDGAILRARKAALALQGAIAAHDRGQAAKARGEALDAYRELVALLDEVGVLDGRAIGGAETEAPPVVPLELPSVDEVAARLP